MEDGCRIDSVYPELFHPGEETATNFSLKITSVFQDFEVYRHSTYVGCQEFVLIPSRVHRGFFIFMEERITSMCCGAACGMDDGQNCLIYSSVKQSCIRSGPDCAR